MKHGDHVMKTDREIAQEQRTAAMVDRVRTEAPEFAGKVRVVGCYLWAKFDGKPTEATRTKLKRLGFYFNPKRLEWLNPCGHVKCRRARRYHPKDKYGSIALTES
jgi:hypothetical protein